MNRCCVLLLCCLLSCAGAPAPAYTDTTIRLKLYNVIGQDSLTEAEVYEAVAWAESRCAAGGYHIQVISYQELDGSKYSWDEMYNLDYQDARMEIASTYLNQTHDRDAWVAHYFIFPPIQHDGLKMYGGQSSGLCALARGALAFGQGGAWSSHTPPRPRIAASGMIIAHEIILGHSSGGMGHHSIEDGYPPNVMDQAAGRFVDSVPGLAYLLESLAESKACLTGVRRVWIKQCKRHRRKKACVKRYNRVFTRAARQLTDTFPVFE